MDSSARLFRLKEFQFGEHCRQVIQLQATIADFERLAENLELEIENEENRAKIHDPSHFAYPTLAKAAVLRRENLKRSIARLEFQLDAARQTLIGAIEESEAASLQNGGDQMLSQSEILGHEEIEQVNSWDHAA